jgi:hypothetical protein
MARAARLSWLQWYGKRWEKHRRRVWRNSMDQKLCNLAARKKIMEK